MKDFNAWFSDSTAPVMERVLTSAAQDAREVFEAEYIGEGCGCGHPNARPPCGWCTHSGNPQNQDEDEECWEMRRVAP